MIMTGSIDTEAVRASVDAALARWEDSLRSINREVCR